MGYNALLSGGMFWAFPEQHKCNAVVFAFGTFHSLHCQVILLIFLSAFAPYLYCNLNNFTIVNAISWLLTYIIGISSCLLILFIMMCLVIEVLDASFPLWANLWDFKINFEKDQDLRCPSSTSVFNISLGRTTAVWLVIYPPFFSVCT